MNIRGGTTPLHGLSEGGLHFVLCPKQSNKIEGVLLLNKVCNLGLFFS